jgi:hypothetical protein
VGLEQHRLLASEAGVGPAVVVEELRRDAVTGTARAKASQTRALVQTATARLSTFSREWSSIMLMMRTSWPLARG